MSMSTGASRPRLVVAITGASGAIYGVRLLQALRASGACESHLVMSSSGLMTAQQELDMRRGDIEALADVVHNVKDIGATIASGSFRSAGMVVAPCSMKTLASIAHGLADNLVARAADVMLKERRPLILVPRETPLSTIHLENMTRLARTGAVILPPSPGFYTRPQSVADVVDFVVARVLDHLGVAHSLGARWGEQRVDGRD